MATLSDIVRRLHSTHPQFSHADCHLAARTILREIAGQLAGGGRVELRDFGAFTVRLRSAKAGRNPKSGAPIAVRAMAVPHFKPGKALRNGVKEKGPMRGRRQSQAVAGGQDCLPPGENNKWAGLG